MAFFDTEAFGLGDASAGGVPKDAYAQLSDLCTALVIADDGSLVPLEPVGNTILTALKAAPTNGDVHVMAARALALLLDKFSFSFKLFKRKNIQSVTECLQHVFSLVATHTSTLTFSQTTRAELIEEILRCLTHGCCSALPAVQKMMPTVEVQLRFCESAVDGSKWASCKVLQHCALLTRRGLETAANEARVVGLLSRQLELLAQLEMDYEWDELLRTTVEGIVTVRLWAASAQTQPVPVASSLLALCERVCASQTAPARKELVLACAALTFSAKELCRDTPADQRGRLLSCVLALVSEDGDGPLEFSNPFTSKKAVTSNEAQADDAFRALPNLQWLVPTVPWSALLLTAKLAGAEPPVKGAYVWAWRGEADTYYWYRQREREAMTAAVLQGRRSVPIKSGTHEADLVRLVDRSVRTEMTTRIHFQPIPCALTYDGTRLCAGERAGTVLATGQSGDALASLLRTLRTLSFGHTALATFAKAVQLHVVCAAGPRAIPDACEAVLRSYAVDHDATAVEALASDLLEADAAMWAPTLLAAGIAEAIEQPLSAATLTHSRPAGSSTRAALGGSSRKRRRSASPPPALPSARRSPVVSLIRDGGGASGGVSPAVGALRLPPHNSLADVLQQSSSTAELIDVLSAMASSSTSAPHSVHAAVELVEPSSPAGQRLSAAVTMYALKTLNAQVLDGRRGLPLRARLEQQERPAALTICPPHGANHHMAGTGPEATAEASTHGWCPSGHPLRIHFSTNWRCNVCREGTAFGAWSCRACNYDLCYRCTERVLHRVEVNDTASVGDVMKAWATRTTATVDATPAAGAAASRTRYASFLYTSQVVVSAALPASVLLHAREPVHCGPMIGACGCGAACPDRVSLGCGAACRPHGGGERDAPVAAWWDVLQRFGSGLAREPTSCRAIVELLETYAADVFLSGTAGLPLSVRHLLSAIRDHLPVDLKRRVAHFLTIGCRRFALQHIQDAGDVRLRGSVVGEVETNGLASRITVSRAQSGADALMAELYAGFLEPLSLRNRVEYRFTDEEGTGSGPTQELYTELSSHFTASAAFWHENDDGARMPFPSCTRIYVREWFVLGAACARAFVDEYQIHIDLLPAAWQLIRNSGYAISVRCAPALWELFALLQPTVARSLEKLRSDFQTDDALAALGLEDDAGAPLTLANREAYISQQVESFLSIGLQNLRSFAMGLLTCVDLDAFFLLSSEEMSHVLCGSFEATDAPLFTEDELRAVTIGAHGYTTGCREVEMFLSIVGNFDRAHQAFFVEFLTGSAYLPANGLKGLKGKITVVRKDLEGKGEQTLPSCNTCFLYLKLPPYSSADIMTRRLLVAIVEGRKNFSLS